MTTAACECNGYDLECDIETGACTCQALGVTGDNCTACTTSGDYVNGDADNFCFGESCDYHMLSRDLFCVCY